MSEIKEFVLGFFKNLNCEIEDGESLVIKTAPKEFEEFIGRKAPYILVFDREREGASFIGKGSMFLKNMVDFLENRGQTSIVKILFNFEEDKIKKVFKYGNCEFFSLNKKASYNIIIGFNFSTTLQYLNEKEQINNSIFIENGEVIKLELEKYAVEEGRKEEAKAGEIKKEYELAKEELRRMIEKDIASRGASLEKKLEKEKERIKKHYEKLGREIEDETEKIKKKIDGEKDKEKIDKLNNLLKSLNIEEKKKQMKKEEEFFISDEEHKHSLNIKNKLRSTIIIYYPIYNLELNVQKKNIKRKIDLVYDPKKATLSLPVCGECGEEIREIFLCSNGHISCKKCLRKCMSCGEAYCKNCLRKCERCERESCNKCMSKCLKCGKLVCKNHIVKDKFSGREYCDSCLKRCSSCGEYCEKDKFKQCESCGREACFACSRKQEACSCSISCPSCGETRKKGEFGRCLNCDKEDCNLLKMCRSCKKELCILARKLNL